MDGWLRLEQAIHLAVGRNRDQGMSMLLLCLDEIPWWIDAIHREEGPESARQALAVLRRIRQHDALRSSLRMVLTGSVGLSVPAAAADATAELNDIQPPYTLQPLESEAAASLFETRVASRGRRIEAGAAQLAALEAGGFPHYVDLLAERAAAQVEPAGAVGVEQTRQATNALARQWDLFENDGFTHILKRFAEQGKAAVAMLDAAGVEGGSTETALLTAALSAQPDLTRRGAFRVLARLEDAFYLIREEAGTYRFLLPLFRRWWERFGGQP